MANHASTRTARLYDHRRDELSVDEVERIVIRGRITQKRSKSVAEIRRRAERRWPKLEGKNELRTVLNTLNQDNWGGRLDSVTFTAMTV